MKPTFVGPRRLEQEGNIEKIEFEFEELLVKIKEVIWKITDVREGSWCTDMAGIREDIQKLDNYLENVIEDVFIDVVSIEDCVVGLLGFKNFLKRPNLSKMLDSKIEFVRIFK